MERSLTEPEPELEPLKRIESTPEEKIHEQDVKDLNSKYPLLDPLMCSVLLKCPKALYRKLCDDPNMWIIPEPTSTLLSGMVSVSDPVDLPTPDQTPEPSPRSVLDTPITN